VRQAVPSTHGGGRRWGANRYRLLRDSGRRGGPGRGLPERAARLLGAVEANPVAKADLLKAGGAEVHAQHGQTVAAVRRGLTAHPQAATWIEVGRRLPLERVVEEALALVEGAAGVGTGMGGPHPRGLRRRLERLRRRTR